jgi:anaerobic magnesium-protoporphyrin IX monomethyl ester cyclase
LVFPETTYFEDPMVFPPLGLFYLRSALQERGHEVDFVDLSEYDVQPDGHRLRQHLNPPVEGYDLHLVSGTSPQASEIRRIGRYLRKHGCTVIGGGPHVTNYAGAVTPAGSLPLIADTSSTDAELLGAFHVLIKHEGERAIFEAIARLDEARDAMERFGRGIVIQHPNIADLGTIPIPDRTDAVKYHYHLDDEHGGKHRGTTMFTSRGCPERCAFCDSPALWSRAVRYVPIPKVVEEFRQIKDLGFDAIHFFDDILPLHQGRMREMCGHLSAFGFYWRCFIRVDIMTKSSYGKAFLQMMYDAGLREVLVGVESGSQRILDGIHKGTTVEQNTLVRTWCREIGIRFKASVILGLPGEDRESMEATRRWVLENTPDRVNVCLFIPFSGTPISKGKDRRSTGYGSDAVHEYDIHWDMDAAALEEFFYAGSRTDLKALTYTSALSSREIQDFWHDFIADVRDAGIPY